MGGFFSTGGGCLGMELWLTVFAAFKGFDVVGVFSILFEAWQRDGASEVLGGGFEDGDVLG